MANASTSAWYRAAFGDVNAGHGIASIAEHLGGHSLRVNLCDDGQAHGDADVMQYIRLWRDRESKTGELASPSFVTQHNKHTAGANESGTKLEIADKSTAATRNFLRVHPKCGRI